MIISSSAIPPTPRGSGARSVPTVAASGRQGFASRHPGGGAPGVVLEQKARRGADGAPFIDAEFVDVLREASVMAKAHIPEDETLRQALKAYDKAAGATSLRGVLLDVDS